MDRPDALAMRVSKPCDRPFERELFGAEALDVLAPAAVLQEVPSMLQVHRAGGRRERAECGSAGHGRTGHGRSRGTSGRTLSKRMCCPIHAASSKRLIRCSLGTQKPAEHFNGIHLSGDGVFRIGRKRKRAGPRRRLFAGAHILARGRCP